MQGGSAIPRMREASGAELMVANVNNVLPWRTACSCRFVGRVQAVNSEPRYPKVRCRIPQRFPI